MCSTTSSGSTTSGGGIPSSATAVPRSTRRVMLLNPCPRNWGKSSKGALLAERALSGRDERSGFTYIQPESSHDPTRLVRHRMPPRCSEERPRPAAALRPLVPQPLRRTRLQSTALERQCAVGRGVPGELGVLDD